MQFLLGAGVFATGVIIGAALVQSNINKILNSSDRE